MRSLVAQAWNFLKGMEPLSMCDWPGRSTCVLFFGGCNLRCPTCHNASIAWRPEKHPTIFPHDVANYVKDRAHWLDGLVVTGGEPTIIPELPRFLEELADLGLPIKLDSNGMQPGVVQMLIEHGLVRAFSVDVKGPYHKYPELTGGRASPAQARHGLEWIFALAEKAPDAFYFRLTRVPGLTDEDVEEARSYLPDGFKLSLQKYVPPRRDHAQAHPQARRLPGNVVDGPHRTGDSQGPESQRRQGPAPGQTDGAQGRVQTH